MRCRFFVLLLGLTTALGCSDLVTPCAAPSVLDAAINACVLPAPTCAADQPGSLLTQCAAEHRQCQDLAGKAVCGSCQPGFALEAGACLAAATCASLDCQGRRRECISVEAEQSAHCGACLPSYVDAQGECTAQTCEPNTAMSLRAACDAAHRSCALGASGPSCGPCFEGYVEEADACRATRRCSELGCFAAHRGCSEGSSHVDAACGACLTGFSERDGACWPVDGATCEAGAAGSILDGCTAEHRNCLVAADTARCGGCQVGFSLSDTGACVAPLTCAELACAGESRGCAELPSGHCVGCLAGFIEDPTTGACRAVKSCASLTCAVGQECASETEASDAFCRPACGANALWSGSRCVPCPPCNTEGELGRWPWPSATGACICHTAPGYFYSLSADVGPFACDGDGDGWLRESARISMESADLALRANARCSLRTIDRVVLQNEGGQRLEVMLEAPLPLYETDRNDDDTILSAIWQARGFPAYGERVAAKELNRFTKLCHDVRMDYNDNGAADVGEWDGKKLGPAMRAEQQPFNRFSYFVELYRGRHEPAPSGAAAGRYVIEEKSRAGGSGAPTAMQVPMVYGPTDGTHWRQCELKRDAAWSSQVPPVGMDFSAYQSAAFTGMNLHSQFKCLIVDEEPDGGIPTELSPATIAAFGYRLNRCRGAGGVATQPSNPDEKKIGCELVGVETVQSGDVLWGARPYQDHGSWAGLDFRYGCYNECIDRLATCPGYAVNPRAVDCLYDGENFGKFVECRAWEVCDGLDNTGEGSVDEGDPEGGGPCDTGESGSCAAGTEHCMGGSIVCVRNAAPSAEMCDGEDNDCDGTADEGDPGGGLVDCTVAVVPGTTTGAGVGECAAGKLHCKDGALGDCRQVSPPLAESCNDKDDDCDGETDEPPSGTQCNAPWTLYYLDVDGDGYGVQADIGKCLCNASGDYRATNHQDCCDSDYWANPSFYGWSDGRNACNSYDWNCNGVEDKGYNVNPDSGCGRSGFYCKGSAEGWKNAVPGCGETAAYYSGCGSWWDGCPQNTSNVTQVCR